MTAQFIAGDYLYLAGRYARRAHAPSACMVHRTVAALFVVLTCVFVCPRAFAHSELLHAKPPVGSAVSGAPSSLILTFSEDVVLHFSSVQVLDVNGTSLDVGRPSIRGSRQLVIPLPRLSPGKYTVIWHVTSEDTHKTEGRFVFTVNP